MNFHELLFGANVLTTEKPYFNFSFIITKLPFSILMLFALTFQICCLFQM